MTILIISPTPRWGEEVTALLRSGLLGCRTLIASGGAEASRLLLGSRCDAVILPHPFRRDRSFSLLALRRQRRHIPFVVVSSEPGEESAVAAMKGGASHYLLWDKLDTLESILPGEIAQARQRAQLRHSELSIRRVKSELEGVLDSVSELIILTDMEDRIVRCNRKVADSFGIHYREIVGIKAETLFYGDSPPEDNPFHSPGLYPPGNGHELFIPRLSGWFTVACTHLTTQEMARFGLVYTLTDITRRKGLEEEKEAMDRELLALYKQMKEKTLELQRSQEALARNLARAEEVNEELRRLNEAKKRFLGIASHELKTPITSILGGVQFLLNYCRIPLTPEQQGIFTSVHEGVLELKGIVDNLLSVSRIESRGYALVRREIDLLEIVHEVISSFALPLSSRHLSVRVEGSEGRVTADDSFIRLVIRNLLENAIKFTPDDGEITVRCRVTSRGELLAISGTLLSFYPNFPSNLPASGRYLMTDVMDTGIGIPPDERIRVFDTFYGVGDLSHHSSGKTEYLSRGSGLGLSIVKGVIDAHGGMVWVTDGERGGSRFTFVLPLMVPLEQQG